MEAFQVKLTKDEELISTLTIVIEGDGAELHQEVYKFTPSIYKEMLSAFNDLKEKLKQHYNTKQLIIGVEDKDYSDKLGKYWSMLGFNDRQDSFNLNGKTYIYRKMGV